MTFLLKQFVAYFSLQMRNKSLSKLFLSSVVVFKSVKCCHTCCHGVEFWNFWTFKPFFFTNTECVFIWDLGLTVTKSKEINNIAIKKQWYMLYFCEMWQHLKTFWKSTFLKHGLCYMNWQSFFKTGASSACYVCV